MHQEAKSEKSQKLRILDWLIETFPAAFFKKSSDVKPLKIGILEDIIEFYQRLDSPPFSKKCLRLALNYYSASPYYLKSQIEGAARIDLSGNEVDYVSSQQAKYAFERYQNYLLKKKGITSNTPSPD